MKPLVVVPPAVPLPDPDENRDWYSETWVRYPADETLYPMKHPCFFKAKCELSLIMNSLCVDLFSDTSQTSSMSAEKLNTHLKSLGNWHFFLTPQLSPAEIIFPHQLNVQ